MYRPGLPPAETPAWLINLSEKLESDGADEHELFFNAPLSKEITFAYARLSNVHDFVASYDKLVPFVNGCSSARAMLHLLHGLVDGDVDDDSMDIARVDMVEHVIDIIPWQYVKDSRPSGMWDAPLTRPVRPYEQLFVSTEPPPPPAPRPSPRRRGQAAPASFVAAKRFAALLASFLRSTRYISP